MVTTPDPSVFRHEAEFHVDYLAIRHGCSGARLPGAVGQADIGDTIDGQTISTWTGGFLSNGGTWTNSSDRNVKSDFASVDYLEILQKVAGLPISEWRYNAEPGQRHVGPMAQDFYAAFRLGADDKHIATIDGQGIALAAIQGLNAKLESDARKKDARIATLELAMAQMQAQIAALAH